MHDTFVENMNHGQLYRNYHSDIHLRRWAYLIYHIPDHTEVYQKTSRSQRHEVCTGRVPGTDQRHAIGNGES